MLATCDLLIAAVLPNSPMGLLYVLPAMVVVGLFIAFTNRND
jgi:hypothetical protein